MVPEKGLEPPRCYPPDFESGASANSATPACCLSLFLKDKIYYIRFFIFVKHFSIFLYPNHKKSSFECCRNRIKQVRVRTLLKAALRQGVKKYKNKCRENASRSLGTCICPSYFQNILCFFSKCLRNQINP